MFSDLWRRNPEERFDVQAGNQPYADHEGSRRGVPHSASSATNTEMCASSMPTASSTDTTTAGRTVEVEMGGWPMGKGERWRAVLFRDVTEPLTNN
jgi:hypothetical protein